MRVYNFSAGPAALPQAVLSQAAAEMLDWQGSGMSVMEMSHRGKEFMSIAQAAQDDLRELLGVPADYEILFMQGGGLAQNSIVPLNLMALNGAAKPRIDFVVTGSWSQKSANEAARYASINVIADSRLHAANEGKFRSVPPLADWQLSAGASYIHLCTNETIDGVEYQWVPRLGSTVAKGTPLVADMSSHILSRVINVADYDCIFGGAQKNIGPAGLVIVIIRRSLLGKAHPFTPSVFDFEVVAKNNSMFNTPPTYAIYIAGLVFKWLKAHGGVAAMEAINIAKSKLLYDAIDSSSLYENRVAKVDRSRMNVPFFLKNESLNDAFIAGAKAAGIVQIKGHKSVGGMRASIYNAMPLQGVQALIDYMREFEKQHG